MWVCGFIDKEKDMDWWIKNVMSHPQWGSLHLTAKRMMYRFADQILESLEKIEKN